MLALSSEPAYPTGISAKAYITRQSFEVSPRSGPSNAQREYDRMIGRFLI